MTSERKTGETGYWTGKKRGQLTDTHKQRISDGLKRGNHPYHGCNPGEHPLCDIPLTDEHKQKIRVANTGKHPSDETLKKQSESHRDIKQSLAQRIKKSCTYRKITLDKWDGFATTERMRFGKTLEYKLWRETIFKRDDYTCQRCGERGGRLNAHHILPYHDWKDPQYSLNVGNGITLCKDCHDPIRGHEYDFFAIFFDIANGVGIHGT